LIVDEFGPPHAFSIFLRSDDCLLEIRRSLIFPFSDLTEHEIDCSAGLLNPVHPLRRQTSSFAPTARMMIVLLLLLLITVGMRGSGILQRSETLPAPSFTQRCTLPGGTSGPPPPET